MQDSLITLLFLGTLLIGTNIFWAVVAHKLINKLMSRSFAEYTQSERFTPQETVKTKPEDFDWDNDDMARVMS